MLLPTMPRRWGVGKMRLVHLGASALVKYVILTKSKPQRQSKPYPYL